MQKSQYQVEAIQELQLEINAIVKSQGLNQTAYFINYNLLLEIFEIYLKSVALLSSGLNFKRLCSDKKFIIFQEKVYSEKLFQYNTFLSVVLNSQLKIMPEMKKILFQKPDNDYFLKQSSLIEIILILYLQEEVKRIFIGKFFDNNNQKKGIVLLDEVLVILSDLKTDDKQKSSLCNFYINQEKLMDIILQKTERFNPFNLGKQIFYMKNKISDINNKRLMFRNKLKNSSKIVQKYKKTKNKQKMLNNFEVISIESRFQRSSNYQKKKLDKVIVPNIITPPDQENQLENFNFDKIFQSLEVRNFMSEYQKYRK